jgi:hypothetical protein
VAILLNLLVVLIFSLWIFLSIVSQFQLAWIQSLKTRDVFHLIPNWRFFAPIPARRDYHLEYRTKGVLLPATRWSRIDLVSRRRYWCAVWNPAKRIRKSFNTQVRRLTRSLATGDRAIAARSLAYLSLLNYLQHAVTHDNIWLIQFRIVTCQDFSANSMVRLVFTSDWHYFHSSSGSECRS